MPGSAAPAPPDVWVLYPPVWPKSILMMSMSFPIPRINVYFYVSLEHSVPGNNDRVMKIGTIFPVDTSGVDYPERLTFAGGQTGLPDQLPFPCLHDFFFA